MEKIKEFIKKHQYTDIILIILLMFIFSFLFSNHFSNILPDFGRELLLPKEILNGAVPYKNINLIFFPLAYYINATIYKYLGVSLNSLIITQTLVCTLFVIIYYFLSKEFLNRKTSLLLSILVIAGCIFSANNLYSYITPYSYARTYGIVSGTICILSILKLYKTDNIKFAYFAAIMAGFSFCCKIEYLLTGFILIAGLILYKKLNIYEYLKIFLCFCIFPITIGSTLFLNGVSLHNIIDYLNFALNFAHSYTATDFYSRMGLYPLHMDFKITHIFRVTPILITIIIFCFFTLRCKTKYKRILTILLTTSAIWSLFDEKIVTGDIWIVIPYILTIFLCFNFIKLAKKQPAILFLLISVLLMSLKELTHLNLAFYGTYSFPFIILGLCTIINEFCPKEISEVKLNNLINFVLIIFIGFHSFNLLENKLQTSTPLITDKGTFYTNSGTARILQNTINYINNKTSENSTILVLPEGNLINFITDRKVDLQCFMLDRLYLEAYGEINAHDMIKNTDSDYIILVKGFGLSDFNRKYLYEDKNSLANLYIYEHYKKIMNFHDDINTQSVIILKKNY